MRTTAALPAHFARGRTMMARSVAHMAGVTDAESAELLFRRAAASRTLFPRVFHHFGFEQFKSMMAFFTFEFVYGHIPLPKTV
jgi:hypothetical protein